MPSKNIVIGQKVSPEKVQRAREMRREPTAEESLLWQHLRANRLQGWHFRRQQIIAGFIVDFYCHKARLVVEVDGLVHEAQLEYDSQRDQVLESRDLRVLRLKNEEVQQDLPAVLARILEACCQNE